MKKRQIRPLFIASFMALLAFFTLFGCGAEKETPEIEKSDNLAFLKGYFFQFPFKGQELDSSQIKKKKDFLEVYYRDFWTVNHVSGGILVAQKGEILLEKYSGYANRKKKDTLNKDTPIHIASVSKVFTATLILKLIEKGKLDLNARVKKYIRKFPYPELTIKTLLNHRSGLPKYSYITSDQEKWDRSVMLSNQSMLDFLIKYPTPLYFKPNSRFAYSNTNYAILALLIEAVTGESYGKVLDEVIVRPLGMKNTFVFQMKDTVRASLSYNWRGEKYPFNYLDEVYGDKNIYSTPRDLYRFDQALYDDDFLGKAIKDSAYKGYSYERKGMKNYGLGMRLMEWKEKKTLLYHNGWWHGNNSVFVRLKEDSATIIALGNKYTRSIYSSMNLVSLFGDYPLALVQREAARRDSARVDSLRELKLKDSLGIDSLRLFKK